MIYFQSEIKSIHNFLLDTLILGKKIIIIIFKMELLTVFYK